MEVRYTVPSKYEIAPLFTIVHVNKDDIDELYIQILESKDESKWMRLGDYLEYLYLNHPSSCIAIKIVLQYYRVHELNIIIE